MAVEIITGDCLDELPKLAAWSVHSIVTDPPYHLTSGKKGGSGAASLNESSPAGRARIGTGFMGMKWDGGDVAQNPVLWAELWRVAKPGAHLLAFGGTRTFHRMACAIEDAGWEIRDCIMWVYGSGFPKSLDVSKAIDKAAGAEREVIGDKMRPDGKTVLSARSAVDPCGEGWDRPWRHDPERTEAQGKLTAPATDDAKAWDGWGTALKPAWEPIIVARKPMSGTVAANVQEHRTGAINVNGCRIPFESEEDRQSATPQGACTGKPGALAGGTQNDSRRREFEPSANRRYTEKGGTNFAAIPGPRGGDDKGRWPANVIHDGSDEVVELFPQTSSGELLSHHKRSGGGLCGTSTFAIRDRTGEECNFYGDEGSAARFFYCAKASGSDRESFNNHPTVKPTALMRYLVRLVTPEHGTVLDPFCGSGTTGVAAQLEGCNCIGIELNPEYVKLAKRRIAQRTIFTESP